MAEHAADFFGVHELPLVDVLGFSIS